MTRRVQVFEPLVAGKVGMYTCGPTVYTYAHVGNLRTYIFADLLRRTLEAEGYEVKHVENITDVGHLTSDADEGEDKIEKGAREQGRSAWEIADFYTEAFKRDLARLQIKEPTVWCKATEHIDLMIKMIQEIERKGFTYRTSDGIYFDTSLYPDYGRLARLDLSGQQAGARIGPHGQKRHPQDFALWKFTPPGQRRQMEWDSPWGRGFPGWHIECSAMSAHYLGVPFDIHTGGVDHIPVHHTNEIAQTWAATGQLLANWWLHGEFLVLRGEAKMSKSAGNFVTLQDLIDQGISPMVYRYFTYSALYRKKLHFTEEALEAHKRALEHLHSIMAALPPASDAAPDAEALFRFHDALRDDLNAPKAVATVWEVAKDATLAPPVKRATLLAMNEILPLGLETVRPAEAQAETPPAEVLELLERRQAARQARDFATADALRAQIAGLGWEVRDTPEGPKLARRPA
jgi:cysteinyl-tRNA synthetase